MFTSYTNLLEYRVFNFKSFHPAWSSRLHLRNSERFPELISIVLWEFQEQEKGHEHLEASFPNLLRNWGGQDIFNINTLYSQIYFLINTRRNRCGLQSKENCLWMNCNIKIKHQKPVLLVHQKNFITQLSILIMFNVHRVTATAQKLGFNRAHPEL